MTLNSTCMRLLAFIKTYQNKHDGRSPSYQEMCQEMSLKSKASIHRIIEKLVEYRMLVKQDGVMRSLIVLDNQVLSHAPTSRRVRSASQSILTPTDHSAPDTFPDNPYGQQVNTICLTLPIYSSNHILPSDSLFFIKQETKLEKLSTVEIFKRTIKSMQEDDFELDEDESESIDNAPQHEPSFQSIGTIVVPTNGLDENSKYFAYLISNNTMGDVGIFKDDIIILRLSNTIKEGGYGAIVLNEKTMVFKRVRTRHHTYLLQSEGGNYSSQTITKNKARIAGEMVGLYRGYKFNQSHDSPHI